MLVTIRRSRSSWYRYWSDHVGIENVTEKVSIEQKGHNNSSFPTKKSREQFDNNFCIIIIHFPSTILFIISDISQTSFNNYFNIQSPMSWKKYMCEKLFRQNVFFDYILTPWVQDIISFWRIHLPDEEMEVHLNKIIFSDFDSWNWILSILSKFFDQNWSNFRMQES